MQTTYLDWCPKPTVAIEIRTYCDSGHKTDGELSETLNSLCNFATKRGLSRNDIELYLDQLDIAYRSDGIFLFAIRWSEKSFEDKKRLPTKYFDNFVSITSAFIKEKLGHVHFFDNQRTSSFANGKNWKPSYKYPVKVALDFPENVPDVGEYLEKILQKESELGLLKAAPVFKNGEAIPGTEDIPALSRLRNKYTRLFDKTLKWCEQIKSKRFPFPFGGIPYFKSSGTFMLTFLVSVFSWTIVNRAIEISVGNRPEPKLEKFDLILNGIVVALLILFAPPIFDIIIGKIKKKAQNEEPSSSNSSRTKRNLESDETDRPRGISRLISLEMKKDLTYYSNSSNLDDWKPKLLFFLTCSSIFAAPLLPFLSKVLPALIGWGPPILIDQVSDMDHGIATLAIISEPSFIWSYFYELSTFSIMVIPVLLLIDDRNKRRPVMGALTDLEGHMLYADILDKVIVGIYRRSISGQCPTLSFQKYKVLSDKAAHKEGSLKSTTKLVKLIRERQERKGLELKLILGAIFVTAIVYRILTS